MQKALLLRMMRTRKQHMDPKEKVEGHRILEEQKTKNPTHDTEKDENRTRTHWRKTTRGYLVDQLAKHGWRWPRTQSGQNTKSTQKRIGTNYD